MDLLTISNIRESFENVLGQIELLYPEIKTSYKKINLDKKNGGEDC